MIANSIVESFAMATIEYGESLLSGNHELTLLLSTRHAGKWSTVGIAFRSEYKLNSGTSHPVILAVITSA
jgi:hypothetical protein